MVADFWDSLIHIGQERLIGSGAHAIAYDRNGDSLTYSTVNPFTVLAHAILNIIESGVVVELIRYGNREMYSFTYKLQWLEEYNPDAEIDWQPYKEVAKYTDYVLGFDPEDFNMEEAHNVRYDAKRKINVIHDPIYGKVGNCVIYPIHPNIRYRRTESKRSY